MPPPEELGRSEVGLRRKAVTLASILVFIALVVGSLFGDQGVLHLMTQRQQAEALESRVDALREENARLAAEIAALRSDPQAVEKLAREELGLARKGETVFVLHEEPTP
ncbi:MAG TPA: septum formation initiator family protein [Vicinamibacteria bacterium]|nr:septum formation initiator family protein [Vicinamibacteria bacterium]